MRRSTAISQVVLLLAFYAAPLLAASSAILPACCRRDGAHHCAMQQQGAAENQAASNQTGVSSPVHCPYRFPAVVLTHAPKLFLNQASTSTFLLGTREIVRPRIVSHVPALFTVSLDNRGPPALTL